MRSKHCNTNGRFVWTARGLTMLKKKFHLVTFHERILVSLWTFQLTLIFFFFFVVWFTSSTFKNLLSWQLLLSQIVVIQCGDIIGKELLNSWLLVVCMFRLWIIKGISCLVWGAWSGWKWMVFWISWPQLFS